MLTRSDQKAQLRCAFCVYPLSMLFFVSSRFASPRTMVAESPSIFRPFLQEFFVKASDPLFTCKLKLDVLTALATKDNCATILGELQTYVLHRDKSFVCAAVRAVGRVADARPEVADRCLQVNKKLGAFADFNE